MLFLLVSFERDSARKGRDFTLQVFVKMSLVGHERELFTRSFFSELTFYETRKANIFPEIFLLNADEMNRVWRLKQQM